MVLCIQGLQDIALFSPGESLVGQLFEWSGRHFGFALRLVPACFPSSVCTASRDAVLSIVDVTQRRRGTLALLERCLEAAEPGRLAVYTEDTRSQLERAVRELGVAYWLGPMDPEEWDAALSHLHPGTAIDSQPGRTATRRANDDRLEW